MTHPSGLSRYRPAAVIVLLLAVGAGLFAGFVQLRHGAPDAA